MQLHFTTWAALLLILPSVIGCSVPLRAEENIPLPEYIPLPEWSVETERETYYVGESVKATLTVKNPSDAPVDLDYILGFAMLSQYDDGRGGHWRLLDLRVHTEHIHDRIAPRGTLRREVQIPAKDLEPDMRLTAFVVKDLEATRRDLEKRSSEWSALHPQASGLDWLMSGLNHTSLVLWEQAICDIHFPLDIAIQAPAKRPLAGEPFEVTVTITNRSTLKVEGITYDLKWMGRPGETIEKPKFPEVLEPTVSAVVKIRARIPSQACELGIYAKTASGEAQAYITICEQRFWEKGQKPRVGE